MFSYPFFNIGFYFILVSLLLFRFYYFDFVPKKESELSGYILRHPYEQDGFQIIEFGEYKLKTLYNTKYYLGEYIHVSFKSNNSNYIYFPEISKNASRTINAIRLAASFREFIVYRVKNELPQPYSGFLLGFVLGYKQDFPLDIKDLLVSTGTLHLIVFSGANVSIITSTLFPIIYKLPKMIYFLMSLSVLLIILLIIGFEIPVLRALLSNFINNLGKIYGIHAGLLICTLFSAYILLFINPALIYDLSFQLSFVAAIMVAFLSNITDVISNLFLKIIVFNTGCTLLLYPLVSFYFGLFSLKSLIVNLLVFFAIEMIIFPGFIYLFYQNIVLEVYLSSLIQYFISTSIFIDSLWSGNINFQLSLFNVLFFYFFVIAVFVVFRIYILPKIKQADLNM